MPVKDLKALYESIYAKDKTSHFLKYRSGKRLGAAHELVLGRLGKYRGRTVLDFGCGEGDFLGALPKGFQGTGVDYSETALRTAAGLYPAVTFVHGDLSRLGQLRRTFDHVTSFGTLEHLADPQKALISLAGRLSGPGRLIVSCPSFLNVRGIIWMTLLKLFDVPMSLSDKHFLTPRDIERFSAKAGLAIERVETVDLDVGQGDYLVRDMGRRLKNALRDAKMDNTRVDRLLEWIGTNLDLFPAGPLSGAEAVYFLKRARWRPGRVRP